MAHFKSAKGLITYKNEIKLPEGSLVKADNIVIDEEDVITPRRGYSRYGSSFSPVSGNLKTIIDYKQRLIRHYDSTLQFDSDNSGTFTSFAGSYNEVEAGLRIKFLETKGNLYFTTDEGIKKISATSSDQFTTSANYIKNAGGVKAVDLEATPVYEAGGFLPSQSKCAYRIVWGYTDVNNNVVLGSPSSRYVLENTTEDKEVGEQTRITVNGDPNSGEYILYYTPTTQNVFWFDLTGSDSEPIFADTIGKDSYRVDISSVLGNNNRIAERIGNTIANALGSKVNISISSNILTIDNTEIGDVIDSSGGLTGLTNLIIKSLIDGQDETGPTANGSLTFTVPSEVTDTNYYYQVYRTGISTVVEGLSLDDIDPGDEMYLIDEVFVESSDISSGTITYKDVTPESFREQGALLYTNPSLGGIAQANEKPPISKDLALFRNYTFYSNTKTVHKLPLDLLSVSDFTTGTSSIVIGNEDNYREYTFIGLPEISFIECGSFADTTENSYIELNSARDEREYYFWFDKNISPVDPDLANKIGIRVRLIGLTTSVEVAQALKAEIEATGDFTVERVNDGSGTFDQLDITTIKNGYTTDVTSATGSPTTDIGTGWDYGVTQQGVGEDVSSQEVLLSGSTSASISIDETARSLVRVINRDANSIVNAYYLSGPNDLPGKLLLESKTLEDKEFYITTFDSNITDNWNPTLPLSEAITNISVGNPTTITSAGHGLTSGDNVYIFNTDSTPALLGSYIVNVVDSNNFTIDEEVTGSGSSGFWTLTSADSDNEVKPNRIYYSKLSQPEAVPLANYFDVGPKDKAIERVIALRDNIVILKEDGVYILTTTSEPFGSRLIDSSAIITAPDSADVLNNSIYCLTTQGISRISENGGVNVISWVVENLVKDFANSRFDYQTQCFGIGYESDRSYLLFAPTVSSDTVATQAYRYNIFTQTWTRFDVSASCGLIKRSDDKMYIGSGDENYIWQERKDDARSDYADINFDLIFPSDFQDSSTGYLTLSSVSDLNLGDVVYQTQYLTISQYNRTLRKLDLDGGLGTDYQATLELDYYSDLSNAMLNLNNKLLAADTSGNITDHSPFSSDFETLQTQYNNLIAELNISTTPTNFKDYSESTGTTHYEALITLIKSVDNQININIDTPFIVGTTTIYKGFEALVQWSPIDFGSPETLKQVREGTVIFDQNNFYDCQIGYSSDLSGNFEFITYEGYGPGLFGNFNFGSIPFGGDGNDVPSRQLIPRNKQRCRYINVRFKHINALEYFRIVGLSLEPRALSTRAYRER